MKPEEQMHPLIYQTLVRYIGYGWGDAIIQSLIRYRFNVIISHHCLRTFREGGDCTAHCQSVCPWKNYVM